MTVTVQHDPRLDLVLERVVDVAPELVWAAWTKPEHVKKWFTPAPWKTVDCEIDLRPGGIAGRPRHNECRLLPRDRGEPQAGVDRGACARLPAVQSHLRRSGLHRDHHDGAARKGTKYTALAMHKDEKDRNAHDRMGFSDGWGKALDQLVAAAKTM